MNGQGFNPRTLVILFAILGFVGFGWVGSKIGHETIFLGLTSGLMAAAGAVVGVLLGYWLAKYL